MTHITGAMKMTIEIPEDVLTELMHLTGHQTKRDAVEFALRGRRVGRSGAGCGAKAWG